MNISKAKKILSDNYSEEYTKYINDVLSEKFILELVRANAETNKQILKLIAIIKDSYYSGYIDGVSDSNKEKDEPKTSWHRTSAAKKIRDIFNEGGFW